MEKETRLNIKLSEELLAKLKEAAKKEELSVSAFVRQLIKKQVEVNDEKRK